MSELLITRGLPASGKSTWAKAWVNARPECRARLNRDCMRYTMFGHHRGDGNLTFAQEEMVTAAQQSAIRSLLARGIAVVADDMNLRPRYVRAWREFAESEGHSLDVLPFLTPVETCVNRDAERPDGVGEKVIRDLAKRFMPKGEFLEPEDAAVATVGAKYVPDLTRPTAVIVDIDGTVALNTSGRGWYDLERVSDDELNEPVADLLHALRHSDSYLAPDDFIYCSGRDERSREVTQRWLHENSLPIGPLFMRPAHDRRQDCIVKRELFDKHIRDNYNVQLVLDDRNQVVRMWRSLGLTCLQVADGSF